MCAQRGLKSARASAQMLDDEAKKVYDRKHDLYETALQTRLYTQHALRSNTDSHYDNIPI